MFGIGEHHRPEFLDSAPTGILGAAAPRARRIRLISTVTVLSAADPVRVFQQFATLDLIARGRVDLVVGPGSFTEAFPLFGLKLQDYDELSSKSSTLLLQIRANERVQWSGRFRPALTGQGIYPRPVQQPLPIWPGVGGTPASFARAGSLGLPLMVAVIGGETHRFRPLVDLYREAGRRAGHPAEQLQVGLHSLGYVGATTEQAVADFYPGYPRTFTRIGQEWGWGPVTRAQFEQLRGPRGAPPLGSPEEVAEKIRRHGEALGGIARVTFQMDGAELPPAQLLHAIELLGTRVKPLLAG